MALIDGREELPAEVRKAPSELSKYLSDALQQLLADDRPRKDDCPMSYSTAAMALSIWASWAPSWIVRVPFGPVAIAAWR